MPGVVRDIKMAEVTAEVLIDSGSNQIVATINRGLSRRYGTETR